MTKKTTKDHGVSESAAVYEGAALSAALSDEEVRRAFGARLLHIRARRSLPVMAAVMQVSPRTLSYYESGERMPDAFALRPLAAEGWNINWLLTGEGSERLSALKQGAAMQPEMMQKAVESAIGVFQRFNKLPSASQLARASVLLYLMFTDTEPDPTQPVDQLLARIVSEQAET